MKVLLIILSFFALTINAAELKPYKGTLITPEFNLKDLAGNLHTLDKYLNKVVLVQFWATYCPPCIKEMPSMNNMQKKLLAANVPFKILAINMAETKDEVVTFVKKVKPKFTILLDETGNSIQKWKVFAAPSNFLISKQGQIKYTLFGGVDWDDQNIINIIKDMAK